LLETIAQAAGIEPGTARKLLLSAAVVALVSLVAVLLLRFVERRIEDLIQRHKARKAVVYAAVAVAALALGTIWVERIEALSIYVGVVSAGVVVALQEAVLAVAGWMLIMLRRPFDIGDRIEVGDLKGDVVDIRLLQTALLEVGQWVKGEQSTGRLVYFPNSYVFRQAVINYTKGFHFIWHEIKFVVTFESDWERARDIILGFAEDISHGAQEEARTLLKRLARRYSIYYRVLTPIVYTTVGDFGVELTLRYLTDARQRRTTEDRICRQVLAAFADEANIEFAYPTYRIVKKA